jgi:hypothetical protein
MKHDLEGENIKGIYYHFKESLDNILLDASDDDYEGKGPERDDDFDLGIDDRI